MPGQLVAVKQPKSNGEIGVRATPGVIEYQPRSLRYGFVTELSHPMMMADLSVRVIRLPSVSIPRSFSPPAGPSGAKRT